MKKIRLVKTCLVLALTIFTTSGFTIKEIRKPTATVTYYYKCGLPYQRMLWNTNHIDPKERSIDKDGNSPPYFKRTSSWTTSVQATCNSTDMTKYICSITFDEEATADGGADGQLTLQEALDAVYYSYMLFQAMPSSVTLDGNATIVIAAKTTAC